MRAVAFNRTAASLMEINPNRIALFAYALAAAIGALAGILVAPVIQAAPSMGTLIGLKAFGVAIVAGISSARGVVIVGICYGVIEKFIEGYISTGARNAMGFTLMILHPSSLPGRHFRATWSCQGMIARRQLLATLVLGVGFLILFRQLDPTNYQTGLLMRCMILMIVTIGLNILIGQAGLVSLGQAALYGLGAYVAAWLAVKQGVRFCRR